MIFTYEVNLLCDLCHAERRDGLITGDIGETAAEAEQSAVAEALRNGWIQVGDKLACPQCVSERQVSNTPPSPDAA